MEGQQGEYRHESKYEVENVSVRSQCRRLPDGHVMSVVEVLVVIQYTVLVVKSGYTRTHNHFTALWTLSGTTWLSSYQKVHFSIFWIFWCKMKITQADAPTVQMDCHPSRLIGAPISAIPTIFMSDALPDTTLTISWLGTGTKYAGLHTRWLGYTRSVVV